MAMPPGNKKWIFSNYLPRVKTFGILMTKSIVKLDKMPHDENFRSQTCTEISRAVQGQLILFHVCRYRLKWVKSGIL
jgi:hypothetical protein